MQWCSSCNFNTKKQLLIIFLSFKFIVFIFIFFVIYNEELFELSKVNNQFNIYYPTVRRDNNNLNQAESTTQTTLIIISEDKNVINSTKNHSSTEICDEKKQIEFNQQAKETTLSEKDIYYLLETIALITSELDKHHIDYITIGGSLLGIIRHGGLISYDDDFDIAIHDKDRSKVIEMFLKLNHSKLAYQNNCTHPKVFINRTNCHQPNGFDYCYPYVDIFFMKSNETHWYFVDFPPVYAIADIYPKKRGNFSNISVWIPNKWQGLISNEMITTCCTNSWNHRTEVNILPTKICIPCACVLANASDKNNVDLLFILICLSFYKYLFTWDYFHELR